MGTSKVAIEQGMALSLAGARAWMCSVASWGSFLFNCLFKVGILLPLLFNNSTELELTEMVMAQLKS